VAPSHRRDRSGPLATGSCRRFPPVPPAFWATRGRARPRSPWISASNPAAGVA